MLHQNSKPLNVIFVVFQTGNLANGGVESISQIIEHRQRIQPIVVTQIETPVNQRWQKAGADVKLWQIPYEMCTSFYRTGLKVKWQRLFSLWQTNWRMYQLVRSTGSSVVHCNDPTALWHTGFGAKLAGAKVVFNIRGTKSANESYGRNWQMYFRLSDRQLVLSQEMRQTLIHHLAIPTQRQPNLGYIYSIVNGNTLHPVAEPERNRIRERLGITPDTFAIGHIATFRTLKAQLEVIEQLAPRLKQSIPNLKIYFVGDFEPEKNEYARRCRDAAQRLNLEQTIVFVGYTPAVSDWYKAVDLVAITSYNEGLARCMIEGLACGTPVVSFDVCSAREILAEHNCGRVIAQADYPAMAEAILDLFEHPDLRRSLSENGATTARALFQPEPIIQQYEALYTSLIPYQNADPENAETISAISAPLR
jgi:glycosyltransferase involved in cell wall biosynthesis